MVPVVKTADVLGSDCCAGFSGNDVCDAEVEMGAGGIGGVGKNEGVASAVCAELFVNSFEIVSVSIAINSAIG